MSKEKQAEKKTLTANEIFCAVNEMEDTMARLRGLSAAVYFSSIGCDADEGTAQAFEYLGLTLMGLAAQLEQQRKDVEALLNSAK